MLLVRQVILAKLVDEFPHLGGVRESGVTVHTSVVIKSGQYSRLKSRSTQLVQYVIEMTASSLYYVWPVSYM